VAAEELEESFFSQALSKDALRGAPGPRRRDPTRRGEDGQEMRGMGEARDAPAGGDREGARRLTTGGPVESWQLRLENFLAKERSRRRVSRDGSGQVDGIVGLEDVLGSAR
jgi:hypothetical protein